MKNNIRKTGVLLALATAVSLAASALPGTQSLQQASGPNQPGGQQGHAPMTPKNLKILPKNISHEELHKVMDNFKVSLGVKCGFCHARSATDSTHLDFASDAKPEKETARHMMKMTARINKKFFRGMKAENGTPIQVGCITCHHGQAHPEI